MLLFDVLVTCDILWPYRFHAGLRPRTRALLLPMLSTAKKIVDDTHDEPQEDEVTCLLVCSVQALHWVSARVKTFDAK